MSNNSKFQICAKISNPYLMLYTSSKLQIALLTLTRLECLAGLHSTYLPGRLELLMQGRVKPDVPTLIRTLTKSDDILYYSSIENQEFLKLV